MTARLEFWFDFASTYSYLSAMRIEALAAYSGVEVSWKPFLLGPIFNAQGWNTSPFNIYQAKGRYMWRDMERICADRNLPFARPAEFPQFTLLAARAGVAGANEPWLPQFCRNIFEEEYGRGGDITAKPVVISALAQAGADPGPIVEAANSAPVKEKLKSRGEQARSYGIFGAPSFRTDDGELFWGDDRLKSAIAWAARQ